MTNTLITSGETAKATTSDIAITMIAADDQATRTHVAIINTGGVDGFWSIDGGNTWMPLIADLIYESMDNVSITKAIMVKRIPSGSNLTGLWAKVW